MKFDAYDFLKKQRLEGQGGAIRAIRAIPTNPNSTNSTNSTPITAKPESASTPSRQDPEAFPYGFAAGGIPRTWTGEVVQLAEWRDLSAWERHGSTGKMWNGRTGQWEPDGGAA